MQSIHGHEVLEMMKNNHYQNTQELVTAIEQKFGKDSRFHTCSKTDMNAEQLVDLLIQKRKFKSISGTGFTVDSNKICNH